MFKESEVFIAQNEQTPHAVSVDAGCAPVLAGGNWPVMLTPFTETLEVDWQVYAALVRFYLDRGVSGLFAVCHSSEMDFLEEEEVLHLIRETVTLAKGRVPVVASLGKCRSFEEYVTRATKVAELGVEAVVFTCSTLTAASETEDVLIERVLKIAQTLPLPIGLYEAPMPYHRLLGDEAFRQLAHSGHISFFKDTCCDEQRIARRVKLAEGTPLRLFNAHMPSLLPTLKAGIAGYSGIGSNFFPELYSRLCACHESDPVQAAAIHAFIAQQEPQLIEGDAYPSTAKHYIRMRGVPIDIYSRKPCLSVLADGIAARQQPLLEQLEHFLRTQGMLTDASPPRAR